MTNEIEVVCLKNSLLIFAFLYLYIYIYRHDTEKSFLPTQKAFV